MRWPRAAAVGAALVVVATLTLWRAAPTEELAAGARRPATPTTPLTTPTTPTAPTPPTATAAPAAPPTTTAATMPAPARQPAPPAPPPTPRSVQRQAWTPFATAAGVVLHHPADRVERVGFHQANHDGAQQLDPLPTAAAPATLEPRHRETGSRTAADVVVHPRATLRAPVTGKVIRGGTYVLYCDNTDEYVVIEPDARPGYEVKVLHVTGLQVRKGQRVEAGRTVLARRASALPFESQVDEVTADPPWPHVHMEIVDPSIPDRPSGHRHC